MVMLGMKKYVIGIVVGVLIGLWMGINIGRERSVWANPFTEPSLANKAKGVASEAWNDAKKAAREKLAD